jgi:hypothetical protein
MSVFTEGKHTGEFLVSKANGTRSMSTGVVLSGEVLVAGQLVGVVSLSGKIKAYNPANIDGTETVAGIIYDNVDATAGDLSGKVLVVRDAEVRQSDLTYFTGANAGQITTANTGLEALGIIVR